MGKCMIFICIILVLLTVKPHLVSSSGDVTTESGATVELVCRVGGDPQPEVFWGRVSPAGAQLPHERLTQEEQGQVIYLITFPGLMYLWIHYFI
jgi:hypothetical protein